MALGGTPKRAGHSLIIVKSSRGTVSSAPPSPVRSRINLALTGNGLCMPSTRDDRHVKAGVNDGPRAGSSHLRASHLHLASHLHRTRIALPWHHTRTHIAPRPRGALADTQPNPDPKAHHACEEKGPRLAEKGPWTHVLFCSDLTQPCSDLYKSRRAHSYSLLAPARLALRASLCAPRSARLAPRTGISTLALARALARSLARARSRSRAPAGALSLSRSRSSAAWRR